METSHLDRKRKVFVANKSSTSDYADLAVFGELVAITKGYVDFGDIQKLSHEVNRVLFDANVEDLLVLSGHNLISLVVGFLWIKKFGKALVLHFDTKNDTYTTISLTNISIPVII